MASEERGWLRDTAHVVTIVSGLAVLGVGGVLAVAFQALLSAIWSLSPVERVLLGGFGFLMAVAILLAAFKYVRKRWFPHKDQQLQENERLKTNIEALEKELEEAQLTEGQIGKLTGANTEDSLRAKIKQVTSERDELAKELASRGGCW